MSEASEIIADSRVYANLTLGAGIAAMNAAIGTLNGLGRSIGGDMLDRLNWNVTLPTPADPGPVPAYTGIHLSPGLFTDKSPTLQAVGALTLPADPQLPPSDLTFVDPQVPSGMSPDANLLTGIPSIAALPALPVMPDLQSEIKGIVAPPLLTLTIPAAPTYVAPEFVGEAPTFDATVPTDLDLQFKASYAEASPIMVGAINAHLDDYMAKNFPQFASGMAAIESRLAAYLAGGSALSPAVENAMFTRTLDKTNVEAKRASQEAQSKAARAGFTMPSAMLLSQQIDTDQERRNKNAQAAIEIYVENAKLEQSNLQFAVTQSTTLRKIALDASLAYYTGLVQINGQALEYARSVVEQVVKAFDVAARYAETKARIYEADATVYRAQLEGSLAVIHAYESTIKGLEAQATVNRVQVDAYQARLSAVKTEADVYRAAVDATVSFAQMERIKVELYDAKVKAFGSQVNAYTAQWQGYEAAVKGQSSRMEVNVGHSRGYEARANAYSAIVKARGEALAAASNNNRQLVETYKANVEAFAAVEHSKAEAVRVDIEAFKGTIEAYLGSVTAIAEKSKANVAGYEAGLRSLVAQANIILEQMKEADHLDITRVTGLANVANAIGAQYSAVAQASLNGMNALGASVTTATA